MPTQAQITAQSTAALTDAQVDRVREILDLSPGSADDAVMVDAVAALSDVQNQRLRALVFSDWDSIPAQPVEKTGGAKGVTYRTSDHRYAVYRQVAVLLGITPKTKAVWLAEYDDGADAIQLFGIRLGALTGACGSEL